MRVLLDTHALLWWIADDQRLSARACTVIADSGNDVYLSAVRGWEIAIKARLGRLGLPVGAARFVTNQVNLNDFGALPVELSHALPVHRRDPFDRLLVAQCRIEGMSILSADRWLEDYGVERVW